MSDHYLILGSSYQVIGYPLALPKVLEAASRRSFASRSLDAPYNQDMHGTGVVIGPVYFDRDLLRDESYGLHWFFLPCGCYSIMHACMAMVEPAISHPPFMPFFTVQPLHHLDRVVGGRKPALS